MQTRIVRALTLAAAAPPGGVARLSALVALGSGSRANRQRGAWFALDENGALNDLPQRADLTSLLQRLRPIFADLNASSVVRRAVTDADDRRSPSLQLGAGLRLAKG